MAEKVTTVTEKQWQTCSGN